MISGGKVRFGMIGAYCERFIDEMIASKIRIEGISNENGVIYAEVSVRNYPKIARLSRKYGVQVRIKEKKGAYFRFSGLRKRPGLIVGTFAAVFIVLLLRLFIWHIEIHGNEELTDSYMLGLLEQYGFTSGAFANGTDALTAERNILMGSDRINWINIEVNGSRADVYISEEKSGTKDDVDFKTPCNIVAGRSGILVDADVSSGKLMYEKGSGFAEGSVIVSGTVSSGNTMIIVHSDAKITADFFEDVEFSMNYTTVEKVPTGSSSERKQLMLFGMVILLPSAGVSTENTVCTEQTEECTLFGIKLPLKIKTETYTAYREEPVTRKQEDIIRLLNSRLELYKYNFLRDYEILDTVTYLDETDEGLTLRARIKLRGDIGVKKPIYEH